MIDRVFFLRFLFTKAAVLVCRVRERVVTPQRGLKSDVSVEHEVDDEA